MRSFLGGLLVVIVLGFLPSVVIAQDVFLGGNADGGAGDIDVFPNLSLGGFGDSEETTQFSARYYADASGQGRIEVEASLAAFWHIYSTTQQRGGPTRTTLTILAPKNVQLTGDFQPDHPPAKSVSSDFDGATIEEFDGVVTWSAPVSMPAGFEDEIEIEIRGLICKSGEGADKKCMPVNDQLRAPYAGLLATNPFVVAVNDSHSGGSRATSDAEEAVAKVFRDGDYVVQWTAVVSPQQLVPGQTGVLKFTAEPDANPKETFHVYKSVMDDSDSSTNFVVTEKSGLKVGAPVANQPFVSKSIVPSLPPVSYYHGKVTWSLPFEVPVDAEVGEKTIAGLIAYQACTEKACMQPSALKFSVKIMIAATSGDQPAAIDMATAKRSHVLDEAATRKWVDDVKLPEAADSDNENKDNTTAGSGTSKSWPFPVLLGFAFLGGLILNVMPCVLPVVGLKIMGFVSQAGEDRRRVLILNVIYVLGIMAVFAILGGVAAVSKFGWGEQFTYFPVKLGLTLLMFALALSYLGVWEIPVPGMAAGKASQDLQSREGLLGAFSKGVFATVLATPCSGPLLGYILGLTLKLSPIHTVVIFLSVGIGMASPYLIIGANPKLIAWLPKPGAWMETMKQLMAFLFLGTVAFFFAQFNDVQKVPVFVSLIGVWFGCWIIGLVPNWAALNKRAISWVAGVTAAALISVGAFNYLIPNPKLAWQDYSEPQLQQLRDEGRTVLVDFGAKWCLTCISNYKTAIDTDKTRKVVDELDAVTMYADWTDHNLAIKTKLEELESRSIPLLVIYPGGRPNEPIILRDLVTQGAVVRALREAGASMESTGTNRSAAIASTKH